MKSLKDTYLISSKTTKKGSVTHTKDRTLTSCCYHDTYYNGTLAHPLQKVANPRLHSSTIASTYCSINKKKKLQFNIFTFLIDGGSPNYQRLFLKWLTPGFSGINPLLPTSKQLRISATIARLFYISKSVHSCSL